MARTCRLFHRIPNLSYFQFNSAAYFIFLILRIYLEEFRMIFRFSTLATSDFDSAGNLFEQIRPLIAPTKQILRATDVVYEWHEFFPDGTTLIRYMKVFASLFLFSGLFQCITNIVMIYPVFLSRSSVSTHASRFLYLIWILLYIACVSHMAYFVP